MQSSDLESTVNRQLWDWLFDLPHRLNVAIEVLDDRHMPVFPAGSTPAAVAIRQMLTTGDPRLVSAISDVLRSAKPTPIEADGLRALCFGLSQTGVLVLARALGDGDSASECRQDLELIGSWLIAAIEASLTKAPNAIQVEPYRMASLQRLLTDAMSRGAVRGVIGAFVEALGVWDDVMVRGYAAGASGGFFQYVAPVGAASSLPAELDEAVVPRAGRMVRLSRAEIDRLGLASAADEVLILRLRAGAGIDYVLVFSGTIDGHEQVRLTLYSDMLRESLNKTLATTTSRVIPKVPPPEPSLNEPLEEAAQVALGRLTAAVGASQAALVVPDAIQDSTESERRRRFRPVDNLFDQLAADAVDAGQQVSVIVASVNETALRPGLVQAWLARTRAQLRAGDFAGVLSDTEIAVLLCDASTDQAAVVSARLKALIVSDDSHGLFLPAFGMTSRSPASPFEGSLVAAARAGAAAVR